MILKVGLLLVAALRREVAAELPLFCRSVDCRDANVLLNLQFEALVR